MIHGHAGKSSRYHRVASYPWLSSHHAWTGADQADQNAISVRTLLGPPLANKPHAFLMRPSSCPQSPKALTRDCLDRRTRRRCAPERTRICDKDGDGHLGCQPVAMVFLARKDYARIARPKTMTRGRARGICWLTSSRWLQAESQLQPRLRACPLAAASSTFR
jgi:uncharacterized C2H2 Zn-finger protein